VPSSTMASFFGFMGDSSNGEQTGAPRACGGNTRKHNRAETCYVGRPTNAKCSVRRPGHRECHHRRQSRARRWRTLGTGGSPRTHTRTGTTKGGMSETKTQGCERTVPEAADGDGPGGRPERRAVFVLGAAPRGRSVSVSSRSAGRRPPRDPRSSRRPADGLRWLGGRGVRRAVDRRGRGPAAAEPDCRPVPGRPAGRPMPRRSRSARALIPSGQIGISTKSRGRASVGSGSSGSYHRRRRGGATGTLVRVANHPGASRSRDTLQRGRRRSTVGRAFPGWTTLGVLPDREPADLDRASRAVRS